MHGSIIYGLVSVNTGLSILNINVKRKTNSYIDKTVLHNFYYLLFYDRPHQVAESTTSFYSFTIKPAMR